MKYFIIICMENAWNHVTERKQIIILLFWEFFSPALADGFSLEFERQQVSSSLRDSS